MPRQPKLILTRSPLFLPTGVYSVEHPVLDEGCRITIVDTNTMVVVSKQDYANGLRALGSELYALGSELYAQAHQISASITLPPESNFETARKPRRKKRVSKKLVSKVSKILRKKSARKPFPKSI